MNGINKEYDDCQKNEKCKSKMSDEMKENSKTILDLIKKISDLKKPVAIPPTAQDAPASNNAATAKAADGTTQEAAAPKTNTTLAEGNTGGAMTKE